MPLTAEHLPVAELEEPRFLDLRPKHLVEGQAFILGQADDAMNVVVADLHYVSGPVLSNLDATIRMKNLLVVASVQDIAPAVERVIVVRPCIRP